MKKGKLRQDDSCHWYFVPEKFIKAFDDLSVKLEEMDDDSDAFYDLCAKFDSKFGKFRIDDPRSKTFILEE